MRPSARVLDLFAVPDVVEPLPGGTGRSVRAGDLVLTPERDAAPQERLSPVIARLAVRLDEDPTRRRQDLRVAMPVPARDGSWVVDGWAASRYEPGMVTCPDLAVTLAAARLFHARLASLVAERPTELDAPTDRRSAAERAAFDEAPDPALTPDTADLLARARAALRDPAAGDRGPTGPPQLVHADLAGHVLVDAAGAPVVVGVAPAWRPPSWAEAVCVLDTVIAGGAPRTALAPWSRGADRLTMLRALVYRLLADSTPDVTACAAVLTTVTGRPVSRG